MAVVVDALKLIGVILPPLIALALISWLSVTQATQRMDEASHLEKRISDSEAIANVISNFQKERGMSCVYLSSARKS